METNEVPERTEYPIDEKTAERIENAFTYHPPKDDQTERYVIIREEAKLLLKCILSYTPESREQSLAWTKIEEAVFWANAAIARNE